MNVRIRFKPHHLIFLCDDCEIELTHVNTTLHHPKFRNGFWGTPDKTKPVTCKWVGTTWEEPTIKLQRA